MYTKAARSNAVIIIGEPLTLYITIFKCYPQAVDGNNWPPRKCITGQLDRIYYTTFA